MHTSGGQDDKQILVSACTTAIKLVCGRASKDGTLGHVETATNLFSGHNMCT
jgi:hypothetical protein